MLDGSISLWNSKTLLLDVGGNVEDAVEVRMENGAVSAVKFCPFEENGGNLLAR